MLIDGGICHWHLRRDGQITIREIISTRPGAGSEMLRRLVAIGAEGGAACIFAKCPTDLEANEWYARHGFDFAGVEATKSGRELKLWRLSLS